MFAGRALAFDLATSQASSELMANARSAGRAMSVSGGCIAATAAGNAMTIATRDVASYEAAGSKTVGPRAGWRRARGRMDAHRG